MSVVRLPPEIGNPVPPLIVAVKNRAATHIDHSGIAGFCPCAFADDPIMCLRLGPDCYEANIAKEDRPRPRAPRRQRRTSAGCHDDGGGGGDSDGPPAAQSHVAEGVS